jgi:hypothetical protein
VFWQRQDRDTNVGWTFRRHFSFDEWHSLGVRKVGAPVEAARKDRKQRFTSLLHHVYDVDRLRLAYLATKRDAAAGIDGETWRHYGENLEANL